MTILQSIIFFVFGTVFGSFYNVVGDRLPEGKSIVTPGSHCTNCNHQLTPIELIPIFSYIFQGGKCKKCKTKLSLFYPMFEIVTGLMFMLCYLKFGLTPQIIVPITLISMFLIIVVSDIHYMIIPDEVLIVFGILLCIEIFVINSPTPFLSGYDGWFSLFLAIKSGAISFSIMFLIKVIGSYMFKKEAMGGGDIKLLFIFGLCLGWTNAILSIFLGSVVGLPISLLVMKLKKTHIVPFGPFLVIGACIIIFTGFDFNLLTSILIS